MSSSSGRKWLFNSQELHLEKPLIMGILNVTPDSFSDGGKYTDIKRAIDHGMSMILSGVDIIDIGGESTRPGSQPISTEEELSRVIPIIESLSKLSTVHLSIDTQKSVVAEQAVVAGASIINDVSAGLYDSKMFEVVSKTGVGYVMMHMQGVPESMQTAPEYSNVIDDIIDFFTNRLSIAKKAGIEEAQIVLDPGIGFGKTLEDNLNILANSELLRIQNRPLLIGASRKSFIGMIDDSPAGERLGGSLAAVVAAHIQNVEIFRVHDVHETKQVLDIFTAIQKHSV